MIEAVLQSYISQAREAIMNKPIERVSKYRGTFRAPVHATGSLANSLGYELTGLGGVVYCSDKIDYVLYGRRPGTPPPVQPIAEWIRAKGLDINPYAVSQTIGKYGTTIWQRWQGENSGLLEDINIEEELQTVANELLANLETQIFAA